MRKLATLIAWNARMICGSRRVTIRYPWPWFRWWVVPGLYGRLWARGLVSARVRWMVHSDNRPNAA